MRRLSFAVWLPLTACLGAHESAAQQLSPPGTGGVVAIDRLLGRLATNKRVLVIAAHPDDEDTELLTLLSRGQGVDAAYLSLSRGEGGQNLIGPELGEGLGLIRTGELLAARSVDGGRQFFTRGFDFGFSKSLAETDRFWPRDTMLADVVRIIRRLRPQVLVAVFSGTTRDGHGQHQQSGVLARQAFDVLRDSSWGPKKLYRGARFDTLHTTLRVASGMLDPADGRSYLQIAMAGRSLHRSQDMGTVQRLGSSVIRLQLETTADGRWPMADGLSASTNAPAAGGQRPSPSAPITLRRIDTGIFDGIDTSLAPALNRYRSLVDSARAVLGPRTLGRVTSLLLGALAELRTQGSAEFRQAKEVLLEDAIARAAGVVVDPATDDGIVVPGQALTLSLSVWNSGPVRVRVTDAAIETPSGWSVATLPAEGPVAEDAIRAAMTTTNGVELRRYRVRAAADAPPSEAYFLVRPRAGALYDWSAVPDSLRGEALDPPLLHARVRLEVDGTAITVRREASWRYVDQASGEIRRPIFVVPAVGVAVSPEVLVWSITEDAPRAITVELTHGSRDATRGDVRLELPPGWPAVQSQRYALEGEGARRSFTFEVRAPARFAPGRYEINAVATAERLRLEHGTGLIDYPHIRPMQYTRTAAVRVRAAEMALPNLRRVGYVRGASDLVPEFLLSIGLPLHVLSPAELERADLSAYDAIVVGSRAYETEPALVANNARLLDYARGGGRVIVQYQQYQFVRGGFAPFPLEIARPHDRVTDETSPVRLLAPNHPLFQTPNRIGAADWDEWVQERGLYFAREWDPAYRPLLEMGDNGERLQGGVLTARLGQGLYVYTGLAFFRELPAGVPGAYRLFLNLLGLEPSNVP